MNHNDLVESLAYIRGVFPYRDKFDYLVENGARGDEVHTIRGDDLAGACWHLNRLLESLDTTGPVYHPTDYRE